MGGVKTKVNLVIVITVLINCFISVIFMTGLVNFAAPIQTGTGIGNGTYKKKLELDTCLGYKIYGDMKSDYKDGKYKLIMKTGPNISFEGGLKNVFVWKIDDLNKMYMKKHEKKMYNIINGQIVIEDNATLDGSIKRGLVGIFKDWWICEDSEGHDNIKGVLILLMLIVMLLVNIVFYIKLEYKNLEVMKLQKMISQQNYEAWKVSTVYANIQQEFNDYKNEVESNRHIVLGNMKGEIEECKLKNEFFLNLTQTQEVEIEESKMKNEFFLNLTQTQEVEIEESKMKNDYYLNIIQAQEIEMKECKMKNDNFLKSIQSQQEKMMVIELATSCLATEVDKTMVDVKKTLEQFEETKALLDSTKLKLMNLAHSYNEKESECMAFKEEMELFKATVSHLEMKMLNSEENYMELKFKLRADEKDWKQKENEIYSKMSEKPVSLQADLTASENNARTLVQNFHLQMEENELKKKRKKWFCCGRG